MRFGGGRRKNGWQKLNRVGYSLAAWSRQSAGTIRQGISKGSSVSWSWPKYLKQPGKAFYHMQKYIKIKPGDCASEQFRRILAAKNFNKEPL